MIRAPSPPSPTCMPAAAAQTLWDAAVIGAGPAGALVAYELARQGARVLLIDRARFPREKVCGGCLNGAALAALQQVGLGDLPQRLAAPRLFNTRLYTRWNRAELSLPTGYSLARSTFDAALVCEAIAAGADFLPETMARVAHTDPTARWLQLERLGTKTMLRARVVLVADGLSGRALAGKRHFQPQIVPASRLGLGVTIAAKDLPYESGTIYMACVRGAYLGMVRLEDGRLNLAAACDAQLLRRAGSPTQLAARLLQEVALPFPAELTTAAWQGTPPLTRSRRRLADERLFVLGDAATYVEPFTGEGMAWALQAAILVGPFASEAIERWTSSLTEQWEACYATQLAARQRTCQRVAQLLRRPLLAGAANALLHYFPQAATRLVQALNAPLPLTPIQSERSFA